MTTTTDKGAQQVPSLLTRRASENKEAKAPAGQAPKAAVPEAKNASVDVQASAARLAAIRDDARQRVASAWTTAKNLLPKANNATHLVLARALCTAPTPVVAQVLRETARLALCAQSASKFAAETGRDLNEFVENESELSKLNKEVIEENKADAPKTAGAQVTAAPGDPEEKKPVEVPAEPAAPTEPAAAGTPEGTPAAPTGTFEEPAMGEGTPGDLGGGGAGVDPATPANEAMDAATEGTLTDSIEAVEQSIQQLEGEVEEAGDEALDLAAIFNPEVQADKAKNLADEGDGMKDMEEAEPIDFGPTDTDSMMDAAGVSGHDHEVTEADFFKGASAIDPLAAVMGGKQASEDVDVPMGDMEAHFDSGQPDDNRDAETDNDGLFGEILMSLEQPTMDQNRDTAPNLETPEAPQAKEAASRKASAPKSSIRTVGTPAARQASSSVMTDSQIASLLLRDDE